MSKAYTVIVVIEAKVDKARELTQALIVVVTQTPDGVGMHRELERGHGRQ